MGRFSGPLITEEIGYELWAVHAEFTYISKTGIQVLVEEGAITDLASVPDALRSFIPKIGYWSQAAAVHDQLYRDHREGRNSMITRLQADRIFREAAKDKAIEYQIQDQERKEWLLYHGVRIGGHSSWMTIKEALENERIENGNQAEYN